MATVAIQPIRKRVQYEGWVIILRVGLKKTVLMGNNFVFLTGNLYGWYA